MRIDAYNSSRLAWYNFELSWYNRPTPTHANTPTHLPAQPQTNRQDRLQYTAPQLARSVATKLTDRKPGGSRCYFCIQNALKLTYSPTRLRASVKSEIFPPVGVREGRGGKEGEEGNGRKRKGREGCHRPDQVWEEIDANANPRRTLSTGPNWTGMVDSMCHCCRLLVQRDWLTSAPCWFQRMCIHLINKVNRQRKIDRTPPTASHRAGDHCVVIVLQWSSLGLF